MLCQTCSKRSICTELCPEAEAYADQDQVELRETLLSGGDVRDLYENTLFPAFPSTKSNEEIILELFFIKDKKQSEIAEIIGVSRQYVSRVLAKYKKMLRERIHGIDQDKLL